jgi:hypothetical protein
MGYDLHITRAEQWTDAAATPITAEEWLALVRSDPEFVLEPATGPYFARWLGPYSRHEGWLDWADGQLYTKFPDSALLRKMVAIADQLEARVQGDDGEYYTGAETLDEWLDRSRSAQTRGGPAAAEPRSWWRRLLGS